MKKINTLSFGARFLASYLLIIVVSLTLVYIWGKSDLFLLLCQNEEAKLTAESEVILKECLSDFRALDGTDEMLKSRFDTVRILTDSDEWLVSPKGVILIDSSSGNNMGENVNSYDSSFLERKSVIGKRPNGLVAREMVSVITTISDNKGIYGYLVLMSPTYKIHAAVNAQVDSLVLCLLLIFILIGLVLGLLYYQSTVPLKTLIRNTQAYTRDEFREEDAGSYPAELHELVGAIRFMRTRMDSMKAYQREFIANVSHDFRSPLTSIKGYTEAIADGTIPPEMQKKYLNIVLFEIERLTKLTEGLLTLNDLDFQGIRLEKEDFELNELVEQTASVLENQAAQKKIHIELAFDEKKSITYGDPEKIRLVVQNLLDNAIKFSPESSVIHIRVTHRNHKYFIMVKDHGVGISKENLPKIWTRFYKTDASRGRDKRGSGLGLSICKEILEAHGENITAISTEGIGTEFIFSLPDGDFR